jgi:hypothetical protein
MHTHRHAAWLPVELLELPSTLFEALVQDPACLQLLLSGGAGGSIDGAGGRSDGVAAAATALPAGLATQLAALLRHVHYNPAAYQHTVLAMLYDLELADVSSKQLGRHAAHAAWHGVMRQQLGPPPPPTTQQQQQQQDDAGPSAAALVGVELSLGQVAAVPRLLAAAGQGYGYAVARALAQLLLPALAWHLTASEPAAAAAGSAAPAAALQGQQLAWRRLLGAGVELSDACWLAHAIVDVQDAAPAAAILPEGARLSKVLQDRGLWPLSGCGAGRRQEVLAAVLSAALAAVRQQGVE